MGQHSAPTEFLAKISVTWRCSERLKVDLHLDVDVIFREHAPLTLSRQFSMLTGTHLTSDLTCAGGLDVQKKKSLECGRSLGRSCGDPRINVPPTNMARLATRTERRTVAQQRAVKMRTYQHELIRNQWNVDLDNEGLLASTRSSWSSTSSFAQPRSSRKRLWREGKLPV